MMFAPFNGTMSKFYGWFRGSGSMWDTVRAHRT